MDGIDQAVTSTGAALSEALKRDAGGDSVSVPRIVLYVMNDGQVRPLLVLKAWERGTVNGVLFFDGADDSGNIPDDKVFEMQGVKHECHGLIQGVEYSSTREPGTWHWPTVVQHAASATEELVGRIEAAESRMGARLRAHLNHVNGLIDSHLELVKGLKEPVPTSPSKSDGSQEGASASSAEGSSTNTTSASIPGSSEGGTTPDSSLPTIQSGASPSDAASPSPATTAETTSPDTTP